MKRYDDLQYNGLILVQDTDYPCFTEDSVLLVNFLQLKKNDKVVDLGSGTGIISVLGQAKSGASFTGIEKYDALCDLARESVSINRQDISFYAMDIADAPAFFGEGAFTAAVCNPPYFSAGDGPPHRTAGTSTCAIRRTGFAISLLCLGKHILSRSSSGSSPGRTLFRESC